MKLTELIFLVEMVLEKETDLDINLGKINPPAIRWQARQLFALLVIVCW